MNKLSTIFAISGLLASSSWASVREAAFASSANRQSAQTSMFAGATYRVSLDRRAGEQRARASLKLAAMTYDHVSSQRRVSDGLELTGGRTGKPALYLAGQDVGQWHSRVQLDGTRTALIVGGIIILGVLVAVVASDIHHDNKCSEEEDC